jgi:hypothetical protein
MRIILAATLLFSVLGLDTARAAVFTCSFSETEYSCFVDPESMKPCQHSYSSSLAAMCRGRIYPTEWPMIICYFGNPADLSKLGGNKSVTTEQLDLRAVAQQWTTPSSRLTNMKLSYYEAMRGREHREDFIL